MSEKDLAAGIVSSYVANNPIQSGDLPQLIKDVYATVSALGVDAPQPSVVELTPAVPVKKSVTKDYIYCLEDGKPFKSLKRHLATHYDLTPDEYRTKWGLPSDYPMVAPSYAEKRSKLAKDMGLGTVR